MTTTPPSCPIRIYVDADACPVKDETIRVARRHGVPITMVANSWMRLPENETLKLVVIRNADLDAADDWIVERVVAGDVVVTADIPLAARCIAKGARVLGARGREFTEDSIGDALATRDLLSNLREGGTITGGGPPPFVKEDRSRFLHQLDEVVRDTLRRRGAGT